MLTPMIITFSILIPFTDSFLMLLFTLFVISFYSIAYLWSFSGPAYAMVTFLIYITGMLVLFSYVLVINPNLVNTPSSFLFFLLPSTLFVSADHLSPATKSSVDLDMAHTFLGSSMTLYFLLVLLLLFILIAVAIVCFKAGTPLRKSFWVL